MPKNLYYWYNDPQNAYLSDVFHDYQNKLNEIFDVVVHEWALNLNIGWEISIFKLLAFLL